MLNSTSTIHLEKLHGLLDNAPNITRKLLRASREFRSIPMEKIFQAIDSLRISWTQLSEQDLAPLRSELLRQLSPESADAALAEVPSLLNSTLLRQKISAECLAIPPFAPASGLDTTFREYQPLGVILQVISGNVFLTALSSWLLATLTRNASLYKLSRQETVFFPLWLRLIERTPEAAFLRPFSEAVITLDAEERSQVQKLVHGIVVWGGEDAVRAYRDGAPARTRLLIFGPKLSFAFVAPSALTSREGIQETARQLATQISSFDQAACTAPQFVWVDGTWEQICQLAEEVQAASRSCPAMGPIDSNAAADLQKQRTLVEVEEALGQSRCFWDVPIQSTARVWAQKNPSMDPSPLHRTLRLQPFPGWPTFSELTEPYRGQLQSCGIAGNKEEFTMISEQLRDNGITRILSIHEMSSGEITDSHDGLMDLPQLLNLTFSRQLPEWIDAAPYPVLPPYQSIRRLQQVVGTRSWKQFTSLPLMNGDRFRKAPSVTPENIFDEGGNVTRSGGSTGAPKYSVFNGESWRALRTFGAEMFRRAGLKSSDKIANFFIAGDLYGSFVSVNHINEELGARSFNFAGCYQVDEVLRTLQLFSINVIQGIPTEILPLLRKIHALDPNIRLERVLYAGAPLSREDELWLRQSFGIQQISSIIGANDGGMFAYQCPKLHGPMHHAYDEYNFIELLREDGSIASLQEPGELVLSSLYKSSQKLVRYQIGDLAQWEQNQCGCITPQGEPVRTFRFLGRSDSTVSIGHHNLPLSKVFSKIEDLGLGVTLQARVQSIDGLDSISLYIEHPEGSLSQRDLVHQTLLDEFPGLKKDIENGKVHSSSPEIYFVQHIQRDPRTGKVRPCIDLRVESSTIKPVSL